MSDWESRMSERARIRQRYSRAESEAQMPPIPAGDPRLASASSLTMVCEDGHVLQTAMVNGKLYRIVEPI